VSDFDNEWSEAPGYLVESGSQKLGMKTLPQVKDAPRGLFGMVASALVAVVLGAIAWFLLFSGDAKETSSEPTIATQQPAAAKPQPVAAAPKAPTTATVATPPPQPAPVATTQQAETTKPVGSSSAMPNAAPSPKPKASDEEVRKAIVPTMSEVEKTLKKKPNPSVPSPNRGLVNGVR
jgi:hypothetical protein